MSQTIPARIVVRRDTAANWTTVNPVLLNGEWGFETDARKLKIGDGASAWSALGYFSTGSGGGSGNTILSGSGAPSGALGVNGDIYLDTAATRLYGPKTAGAWGSGVSLIGAPGANGTNGTNGTAATVAVGTVTTGAAGSSAAVTNSGTSSAAIFNFTIPRGDAGANGTNGTNGTAATVAVGTVTTGAAGSSAAVTNSGTSSAAIFNFTIPRGDTGAGGGGGGSPGGSATQVQYQGAGAVFAGAANVQIISDNLQLTAPGSTPAAAQASSVVVYPTSLANRFMLAMRGPTGAATLLQPSIFSNNIVMFSPQSGTTGTGSNSFQVAWTSSGTVSHPAPAATDVASSGRRTNYSNVATTQNQQLGPRFNTDSERCFFRGNVANTGGFFYFSRFRLTCPAATVRLFSGLQGAAATAGLVVTDTPTGPYCGLAHVTTDPSTGSGALSFVTKDYTTSNALPINLGSDLVTGSPLLEFSMYCAPNGGTIFFRLDDVTNGVTYTNSTTANLPATTVMMSPQCQASNGTANVTVGTVAMSVYRIYVESVY